ncbi:MAG: FAD-dependent oxidoreductase [Nocardioides sp.]|nr:FAD-dependent oxidoreductase [Nocardioidaceae bacterium]MCB8956954.1 FAD-dependent oxidoreductase [Nocardioides sp.]
MSLTSLWNDRRPHVDPVPPAVAGEWDVVVVGGGLTGLTTAGLLARAGKSVLVIEARHVGAGTTGGSTAKVSLLQGTHYSRIARRHPAPVLRRYADANAEGLAWIARFCTEHGVDHQRRPAYTYAHGEKGARSVRSELDALHRAGVEEATWVDEVPLPFATAGAVRLDDQLQLDPVELVDALAADARAHGVVIAEGARVERVHGRRPHRVVTEAGDADADTVVIATNMPILDRGGFFARAKPARSYSLAFRTAEPAVDGMFLSADQPSRSLRDAPDADGPLLLVGGEGHKVGASTSEREHLDRIRAWTAEHFPGASETHAWSAQDYLPHHALPYAGPLLPGAEGILVAGGYSKWGLTNGVAAALALSGRILGGHLPWASAYEPWSTRELSGLPDGLRINAGVAVEMTTGWFHKLTGAIGGGEERPVCTHLGGVLRWNDAEESWDCPLHGSRFAPDGSVLEGPATCPLQLRPAEQDQPAGR